MDSNPSTAYDYQQESKPMTEIEQAISANLPATIDTSDPDMLRKSFQSILDGVMNLSSFARELKEVRGEMDTLKNEINVARAQLAEAYAQRDEARAEAAKARHDAQMAREAYDTVNERRIAAESQAEEHRLALVSMTDHFNRAKSDFECCRSDLECVNSLLAVATKDKDHYQEALIKEQNGREKAELRVLELEEANEWWTTRTEEAKTELDIRERALTECADRAASLKLDLAAEQVKTESHRHTIDVLNERVAHYEKDIDRLAQDNANYRERLRGVKNMIGGDI